MRRKHLLLLGGLICLDVALPIWAAANPLFIEQYYSQGFYPLLSGFLRFLFGWLHFSVAELILLLCVFAGLYMLYRLFKELSRLTSPDDVPGWLLSCLFRGVTVFVTIHLAFVVCWGLNYYRLPLGDALGLTILPAEKQELLDLAREMADIVNNEREMIAEDTDGVASLGASPRYWLSVSWDDVTGAHPGVPIFRHAPYYQRAKPVLLSSLMSYTHITGFFFPFTGESNINMNTPVFELPATISHELAHHLGIAREDEANYVSWRHSRSKHAPPEVRYSGSLRAFVYVLNASYNIATPEEYANLWALLSDAVLRDLAASREFWDRYRGRVQTISEQVNDTYLKSNQQADGVQSYGRMVDLLLAERRVQGKLNP